MRTSIICSYTDRSQYVPIEKIASPDRMIDIFDKKLLNQMKDLFIRSHQNTMTLLHFSSSTANDYPKKLECYYSDKMRSQHLDIDSIQEKLSSVLEKIQAKIEEGEKFDPNALETCDRDSYYLSIISDLVKTMENSQNRNSELPEFYFIDRLLIRLIAEKGAEIAKQMFQEQNGDFANFKNSLDLNQMKHLKELQEHIVKGFWTYNNARYTQHFSADQEKMYKIFYNSFFLQRDRAIFEHLKHGLAMDIEAREMNSQASLTGLTRLERYDVVIQKKRRILNVKIASAVIGILLIVSITAINVSPVTHEIYMRCIFAIQSKFLK